MQAQNCQGRALFKTFKIKVDYNFELKFEFNSDFFQEKATESLSGTWEQELFVDFTKREISCPELLAKRKGILKSHGQGWAHKTLDKAVVRDFSAGYPFPSKNSGVGYEYPAEYYANQKYPNNTTPNPNPDEPPIPPPPEPVPLLDKLRSRQPFIPLVNNQTGIFSFDNANTFTTPFYYKIDDLEDPLNGYPPNWIKDEQGNFVFALTPDNVIFDSKDAYTAWLATHLIGLKTPVFYPGAPNDPEPDANPRNIKTLFDTKEAWMNFLNGAGGKGINCGGQAQCGVKYETVSSNELNFGELTYTYTYNSSNGDSVGTAKYRLQPSDIYLNALNNPVRVSKKTTDILSQIKIDKNGNFNFDNWQNFSTVDVFSSVYQNGIDYFKEYFLNEFFNKNQKGCENLKTALSKIPTGNTEKYPLYNLSWVPFFDNFENFLDFQGDGFYFGYIYKQGFVNEWMYESFPTAVLSESDTEIVFVRAGKRSEPLIAPGQSGYRSLLVDITYTITYEDL